MSERRTANRVRGEGNEEGSERRSNNNTRRVSRDRVSQREVDNIIICLRQVIMEQNILIGALWVQNQLVNGQNFTRLNLGWWDYAEIHAVIDRVRGDIVNHQNTLFDILRDLSEDTDDENIIDEEVNILRADQYIEDTVRSLRRLRRREERRTEAQQREQRREERRQRRQQRRLRRAVEVHGERRAHDIVEEGTGTHENFPPNEIDVHVAQQDERENEEGTVDEARDHGSNYNEDTNNE